MMTTCRFFSKAEASDKSGLFYSTAEFRQLLPSCHGNPLRSMLASFCGWTQDGDAKTMKRWIVSAVAALMALLLVPAPRAVARVRAPAGSARRSRRFI
jgi:hypothetical protein